MSSECDPVGTEPSTKTVALHHTVELRNDDPAAIDCPSSTPEFVNIKMEVEDYGSVQPETSRTEIVEVIIKPEPLESCETFTNGNSIEELNGYRVEHSVFGESVTALSQDGAACRAAGGGWRCAECHKTFVSRSNLQRHVALHTRPPADCPRCGRTFLSAATRDRHAAHAHCQDRTYECDECQKTFRSSSNLMQHKRIHLLVKPFSCDICEKQFSVRANMMKHRGKSRCRKSPAGPLVCDVCDKVFKREYLLKSHLRMHTTETPFECDVCSMSFKYKSTLIRHVQLHNGDKPHSCGVCGKTFTSSGLIKPHMRRHTGERPYVCPICQKRFSHKHNMQRHAINHNKIKHLVCEVCHKRFPKESRLKYHMRVHMADKRPFKCDYCPKSFSHRQNILRHFKRKHPTETYDKPDTDASVATIFWKSVLQKKREAEKDYIIPENDWPDEVELDNVKVEGVQVEIVKFESVKVESVQEE